MTAAELKQRILSAVPDFSGIQEIRMRVGRPVILQVNGAELVLSVHADQPLIREILEVVSGHSLYAFEDEIRQGFMTIEGGHRIGIAGKAVTDGSSVRTIRDISGLNIRVAHEYPGCADPVLGHLYEDGEVLNTLILSPPGCGKTTLLRDMIRRISDGNRYGRGRAVSVVDERSELAACYRGIPQCDLGIRTDVLDRCPKALGMQMMLRSMSPEVLAVDEIGCESDFHALRDVLRCGCRILATVHGDSVEELRKRPVLDRMIQEGMFRRYVVLARTPAPGTVTGVFGANGAPE